MKKKTLLTAISVVLILAMVVGGTLAYLQDHTDERVNTFQVQTVDVDLTETNGTYNIIPGFSQVKDAAISYNVTLPSFVFLKVDDNASDYVTWDLPSGWQTLSTTGVGKSGVYYIEVNSAGSGSAPCIENGQVTYKDSITNLNGLPAPTLSFTGYVIQRDKSGTIGPNGSVTDVTEAFSAQTAWTFLSGGSNIGPATSNSTSSPAVVNSSNDTTLIATAAPVTEVNNRTTVVIPVGASTASDPNSSDLFAGDTTAYIVVDTNNFSGAFEVSGEDGEAKVSTIDVTLYVNDVATTTQSNTLANGWYTVSTYTFKNLDDVTLKYGTGEDAETWNTTATSEADVNGYTAYYDKDTGKIVFQTKHFTQFEVNAKAVALNIDTVTAYNDLNTAVTSAKDGETVKLLKNITVSNADMVSFTDYWGNSKFALATKLNGITFDGDGHTITIAKGSSGVYLFGELTNSTVKDFTVNYDNVSGCSIAWTAFSNSVMDTITTTGSEAFGTGNSGAFIIYPFCDNNFTMKNCVNKAELISYTGDTTMYDAVFIGYMLGEGKVYMTDCSNEGSLVCGKAGLILANWAYSTRADFVISNVKNNGTIRSTNSGYYNGEGAYNYATSDYWDKSVCLTFTYGDTKYTSSTSPKWYQVEAQSELYGTGQYLWGSDDSTLSLNQNDDGTFTITPSNISGIDRYVVSVGTYVGTPNGSSRVYVTETLTPENLTTTLKYLSFVDKQWVDENNPEEGKLAGFTIYTLNGVSYYSINNDEYNVKGQPHAPEMISVSAYKGDTLMASYNLVG